MKLRLKPTDESRASVPGEPLLQDTRVGDDLSADDGQDRSDALDVLVGHGEKVAVEHGDVRVVPHLDRAKVVLLDEPLVRGRREPEPLRPRQRLASTVDVDG